MIQSSERPPIYVQCSPDTTLSSLVHEIIKQGNSVVSKAQQPESTVVSNPQDVELLLSGALDLSGCDLLGVDISGKDLRGRNFNNANLTSAVANGTNFSDCTFEGSVCVGLSAKVSICQNTNFKAGLNNASFLGANLRGALFSRVFLVDVDFSEADLSEADFGNARFLGSTNFRDAVVSAGTNFEGATGPRPLSRLDAFHNFEYADGTFKRRAATVALSDATNIRTAGAGGLTAAAGELGTQANVSAARGTEVTARAGTPNDTRPELQGAEAVASADELKPVITTHTPPQPVQFQPPSGSPPVGFGSDGASAAIQRALVVRPVLIRDSARALAQALKEQAVELQHAKPNEPAKLAEYESLIAFIDNTADGLQAFGDAIDNAIQTGSASPEPLLLGKAAEIGNQLQIGAMEWLQANRTTVFEGVFRLGLFGLGVVFVAALGIEVTAPVVATIGTLAGTVGKGKADAK